MKNAESSISQVEKAACLIGFLGLLIFVSIIPKRGPIPK
jgi:hypothetical protein